MQATFTTIYRDGAPVLPPMNAGKGELQLGYVDADGNNKGGWVCLSYVPAKTVIVLVDSTPETIKAMAALPDYIYIEQRNLASDLYEVVEKDFADTLDTAKVEGVPVEITGDEAVAVDVKPAATVKAWLVAQKYTAKECAIVTAADVKPVLITLHKLTEDQYKSNGSIG